MTNTSQLSPDLIESGKRVANELLGKFNWEKDQSDILKEQALKGYVIKRHGEIAKTFKRVIPTNADKKGIYMIGWGASIKVQKRIALTCL